MTGDFPRQYFPSVNDTPTSTSVDNNRNRNLDISRNTQYSSSNATPNWLLTLAGETISKSDSKKSSNKHHMEIRKDGSSAASSLFNMSLRLTAKRTIFRTLCILTIFMLAYHLFASVELRDIRNIREKYISDVNAIKAGNGAGVGMPAAAVIGEATITAAAAGVTATAKAEAKTDVETQAKPETKPETNAASEDPQKEHHN
ncbi:hypothetical protein BZA77DRAFT_105928 [Pyronema omphalodes]|nr:hypothetical protein BZA77DRAFT_105928 [Pyronema omphalodes]